MKNVLSCLILLSPLLLAGAAVGATRSITPPPPPPPPPPAQSTPPVQLSADGKSGVATCETFASVEYMSGSAHVTCLAPTELGKPGYDFWTSNSDHPSAADVIAFVQPYVTAHKIVQVLSTTNAGGSSIQSFEHTRLIINFEGNKITGLRMRTVN